MHLHVIRGIQKTKNLLQQQRLVSSENKINFLFFSASMRLCFFALEDQSRTYAVGFFEKIVDETKNNGNYSPIIYYI